MCLTCTPRRTKRRRMEQLIQSGNENTGRGYAEAQRTHSIDFYASRRLRVKKALRGFTFVELLVVITIVVILITMAIPIYNKSIIRTKEAVLRSNLFSLRTVIDNYTYDKQKAPQSLQELVTAGYLRDVPMDPMT